MPVLCYNIAINTFAVAFNCGNPLELLQRNPKLLYVALLSPRQYVYGNRDQRQKKYWLLHPRSGHIKRKCLYLLNAFFNWGSLSSQYITVPSEIQNTCVPPWYTIAVCKILGLVVIVIAVNIE